MAKYQLKYSRTSQMHTPTGADMFVLLKEVAWLQKSRDAYMSFSILFIYLNAVGTRKFCPH